MLKFIKKIQTLIVIIFTLALLIMMFFLPAIAQIASIVILLISISMAFVFTFQKHWSLYQQAESTREKMTRNLILDLLGLLFTMGAAMYVGRLAGGYFGFRAGFWVGLLAGFVGGFLAAWLVRSAWGKLSGIMA
jgi:hypothetical protein